MKIIDFNTIRDLNISPLQCYEWVTESIAHKNEAVLPAKISMKPGMPGVFYNCMPSAIPATDYVGVKVVNRYPQRAPSLDSQILLYELSSGRHVALLDGNWITAMRTGAVAAHSVKLFAKKDFHSIGFIGLGNTARATLRVLTAIYPGQPFTIYLKRYKDQQDSFCEAFASCGHLRFVVCESYEDVVENSDVTISAVTVFEEDICRDESFRPGCLIVPVHTRGFTNCDLFFDKVFADDTNHVRGFKNFSLFRSFSEVTEVVNGRKPGRESESERILAYNIGISLHDIYFAGKIYERLSQTEEFSLNPPEEKFWI